MSNGRSSHILNIARYQHGENGVEGLRRTYNYQEVSPAIALGCVSAEGIVRKMEVFAFSGRGTQSEFNGQIAVQNGDGPSLAVAVSSNRRERYCPVIEKSAVRRLTWRAQLIIPWDHGRW